MYMVGVILIAICGGFVEELGSPLARITFALFLPVITFPMGALGALCALALIYPGIATASEAIFIAGPVYAIAGMMQWYVVLPKLFGLRAEAQERSCEFKR